MAPKLLGCNAMKVSKQPINNNFIKFFLIIMATVFSQIGCGNTPDHSPYKDLQNQKLFLEDWTSITETIEYCDIPKPCKAGKGFTVYKDGRYLSGYGAKGTISNEEISKLDICLASLLSVHKEFSLKCDVMEEGPTGKFVRNIILNFNQNNRLKILDDGPDFDCFIGDIEQRKELLKIMDVIIFTYEQFHELDTTDLSSERVRI
jgi:hypothetical protein